jgi:hypothetical protein
MSHSACSLSFLPPSPNFLPKKRASEKKAINKSHNFFIAFKRKVYRLPLIEQEQNYLSCTQFGLRSADDAHYSNVVVLIPLAWAERHLVLTV